MSDVPRPRPTAWPIRIVLADDHPGVRAGLRLLLQTEPDIEVVAEVEDAGAALGSVIGHRPDVLVLDLNMPGVPSSLDAIPLVTGLWHGTRVVILTMQDDPAYARRALQAGASAYVLKEAADTELAGAIRSAALQDPYATPAPACTARGWIR